MQFLPGGVVGFAAGSMLAKWLAQRTFDALGAVDLFSKVVETVLVAVLAVLWVARRRVRRAEQPQRRAPA